PFTTLNPELGVMEVGGRGIVLAEIPGLVEGAAQGAGLGLRFLRHVERTRLLVYVIDGAAADPVHDLAVVRAEVASFSALVADRPHIVVVNKMDLPEARRSRTRRKWTYYVSAKTGDGIPKLAENIAEALAHAPELPAPDSPRPSGRRRGRRRMRRPGPGRLRAHRHAAAQAQCDGVGRAAPRDVPPRHRGRSTIHRLEHRAGASGTVVHARHAPGAARREPARGDVPRPRLGRCLAAAVLVPAR